MILLSNSLTTWNISGDYYRLETMAVSLLWTLALTSTIKLWFPLKFCRFDLHYLKMALVDLKRP